MNKVTIKTTIIFVTFKFSTENSEQQRTVNNREQRTTVEQ